MRPLIYVQVYRGHFIAKRIGNGKTVRKECVGLEHPRTLMGDITKVEESFSAALKELVPTIRLLKPKGLVHLLPVYEGGYTNVELRAFKEAGELAGINFAFLSTLDRPHTDAEILQALR
jgi:hypothetical protein